MLPPWRRGMLPAMSNPAPPSAPRLTARPAGLLGLLGLIALACGEAPATKPQSTATDPTADLPGTPVYSACGDGLLDAGEACDEGEANSDTEADACRLDCRLPACGDGVTDALETCDDAGTWGGDGCAAACTVEAGALEAEPNEGWEAATPVELGPEATVNGSLPAGDLDCWSIPVPECGAIEVIESGDCEPGLLLSLHDPDGALLAVGSPGADGCAHLDPFEQPGARWVREGAWSVCVEAQGGVERRGYTLTLSTPDSAGLDAPSLGGDNDGDEIPDSCDPDLDGDGLDNEADNCPELSNGPDTPAPAPLSDGWIPLWLTIGPFTTGVSSGTCRPSEEYFVGEQEPVTAIAGDQAGDVSWIPELGGGGSLNFLNEYGGVSAPREAYALVYLRSDSARTLSLSVGADDGFFGWWNGALVLDVSSCQGVNPDQFAADVEVAAGWNSLLFKVYDQGGGWGLAARLREADGSAVTDLELSILPDQSWRPDQQDRDSDGLGDLCDPDPDAP